MRGRQQQSSDVLHVCPATLGLDDAPFARGVSRNKQCAAAVLVPQHRAKDRMHLDVQPSDEYASAVPVQIFGFFLPPSELLYDVEGSTFSEDGAKARFGDRAGSSQTIQRYFAKNGIYSKRAGGTKNI